MSTSSTAADPSPRAGFTLLEVLIALVVAGLLLGVLSRALAGAWGSARAPMDIVSAVTIARAALAGEPVEALARGGFSVERQSGPVEVTLKTTKLAPAPTSADASQPAPGDASSPQQVAGGQNTADAQGAASVAPPHGQLRHVSVVVTTPLGRKVILETVQLDTATN